MSAPRALVFDLLAFAERYLAAGWPVFVLGRAKRPVANCADCRTAGHDPQGCDCLTCHGFYAATADPVRVAAMIAAVPGGLLAIRTGAPSGLVVVDVDTAHGGRIDLDLMPPTACVATGSGGYHLYYRHPGTPVLNSQGQVAPGCDVRGDGGYVVAPPSLHPATGRAYRWVGGRAVVEMPPPLLAACRPVPAPAPQRPLTPTPTAGGGGISSPTALLAAHLAAVARAPVGRRRGALYGAARGVARMVAAGAITARDAWEALTDAGLGAQQTDREIRAAIAGGFTAEGVPAGA
jgi:Bifunctional DNA primase/polymerase, N-terminal